MHTRSHPTRAQQPVTRSWLPVSRRRHLLSTLVLAGMLALAAPTRALSAPEGSGGDELRSFVTADGRERTYRLHLPARPGTARMPLLLVLHGGHGSSGKMQNALGFDTYADRLGFAVLYPDGYAGGPWNDGRNPPAPGEQGIDDVEFLVSLVDSLTGRYPIDPARVFVTGGSNGGMMTYRLSCETSGRFAGFAPVIGNIPAPIYDACRPDPALRFLAINGDADPLIPYAGGAVCAGVPKRLCGGGEVVSFDDSLARFGAAAGCRRRIDTPEPPRVDDGTAVERTAFEGCTTGADIRAITVNNGGHAWPPLPTQLRSSGISSRNLNATWEIVRFFFVP